MDTNKEELKNSLEDSSNPAKCAGACASDALDLVIDLLEDVQKVVTGGRPKMMKIKFGDRVIAEVPVALTAAAAFAAGLTAVLLTKLVIEVEHED